MIEHCLTGSPVGEPAVIKGCRICRLIGNSCRLMGNSCRLIGKDCRLSCSSGQVVQIHRPQVPTMCAGRFP